MFRLWNALCQIAFTECLDFMAACCHGSHRLMFQTGRIVAVADSLTRLAPKVSAEYFYKPMGMSESNVTTWLIGCPII